MTTIALGIAGMNHQQQIAELKAAYERRGTVPAVWIDVEADLKRPVMQRKGYDRLEWFGKVLGAMLDTSDRKTGDLDIAVTIESDTEAALIRDAFGMVVHWGDSRVMVASEDMDLRGLGVAQAAKKLAVALR